MSKIDVSKIKDYASMTAEQKIAALEALDIPDESSEVDKWKKAADKASSEAAEFKKKYNSTLTDTEKNATETADKMASMQKTIDALTREKNVAAYTAKYVSQGYGADLAAKSAEALADGKLDVVFANSQKFIEDYAKSIKAESVKNMQRPDSGAGASKPMDMKSFRQMSDKDRYEFSQNHPDEYKALYTTGQEGE